jgi:hypothetical protein
MINPTKVWGGAGKFAGSSVGTLAFGTIMGGVGASLAGGNFWQGATTGLIVGGLNHVVHGDNDPPRKKNKKFVLKNEYSQLETPTMLYDDGPLAFMDGEGLLKGIKWLSKFKDAEISTSVIGKFYKFEAKVMAANGNGSYTIFTKYINAEGRTVKFFHDTFDVTGKFINRGWTEGAEKVHLWWNGVIQYGKHFFIDR